MKKKQPFYPFARKTVCFFFLSFLLPVSCNNFRQENPPDTNFTARHLEDGVLTVALENNATDYFLYKGYPMGYHLELLELLARHLGCQLSVIDGKSLEEQNRLLREGEIDLIASNLSVSPKRQKILLFSHPLYHTSQVLVQLKSEYLSDSCLYVQKREDLFGKKIHVRAHSVFEDRIREINRQTPGWKSIHAIRSQKTEEELLWDVAMGRISYTVASRNKARHFSLEHKQIDYHLEISPEQGIAWAMRPEDDSLQAIVNLWIDSLSRTPLLEYLYHKYYELPFSKTVNSVEAGFRKLDSVNLGRKYAQFHRLVKEGLLEASDSSFLHHHFRTGKRNTATSAARQLSPFDSLLKKYSPEIPWDWRLLASLIYQESQFQSHLVSKQGAIGLMQMMPSTARAYHITVRSSEEAQIKAGTAYIASLYENLKKNTKDSISPQEMIHFVLAAYNIGPGHVLDARRLARKYGANPNVWYENVETYLSLKSDPKYYKDPECRNGYARGKETVDFVRKIDRRYMHYCNLVEP